MIRQTATGPRVMRAGAGFRPTWASDFQNTILSSPAAQKSLIGLGERAEELGAAGHQRFALRADGEPLFDVPPQFGQHEDVMQHHHRQHVLLV